MNNAPVINDQFFQLFMLYLSDPNRGNPNWTAVMDMAVTEATRAFKKAKEASDALEKELEG